MSDVRMPIITTRDGNKILYKIAKEKGVKNFDRLRIRLIFVVKMTNRLLTHKYISV